jgi:hypothetical protein
MNTTPSNKKINPKSKAIIIIVILIVIGLIIGLAISRATYGYVKEKIKGRTILEQRLMREHLRFGAITISINIILLLGLLVVYVDTFRKTKSSFILGLLLFIGVLFLKSIVSFPILIILLGYSLSVFSLLPFMFETIALIILLYLSME